MPCEEVHGHRRVDSSVDKFGNARPSRRVDQVGPLHAACSRRRARPARKDAHDDRGSPPTCAYATPTCSRRSSASNARATTYGLVAAVAVALFSLYHGDRGVERANRQRRDGAREDAPQRPAPKVVSNVPGKRTCQSLRPLAPGGQRRRRTRGSIGRPSTRRRSKPLSFNTCVYTTAALLR